MMKFALLTACFAMVFLTGCGGDPVSSIGVALSLNPSRADVPTGGTQTLTASMVEVQNPAEDYVWTIREGSGGGAIVLEAPDDAGFHNVATYQAPTVAGVYHVDVKARFDGDTFHRTATITVH